MKNKLARIIRKSIRESKELCGYEKLEATVLLDTALGEASKIRDHFRLIMILEDLYDKVEDEEHKGALLEVMSRYKREIRNLSYDPTEESITLGGFLKSLGIQTTQIPQEKLDLKLMVGIDDGMGYTPGGFRNVTSSYPDDDDIKLWV